MSRIFKVQKFKGREYVPLEDVLAYVDSKDKGRTMKGFCVNIAPAFSNEAPPREILLMRDGLKRLDLWNVPLRVTQSDDGKWIKFEAVDA